MSYPKVSTAGLTASQENADPDEPGVSGAGNGVPASPRFPEIEERVLAYWEADDTFRASVSNRPAGEDGSNEFVFYDGPPNWRR